MTRGSAGDALDTHFQLLREREIEARYPFRNTIMRLARLKQWRRLNLLRKIPHLEPFGQLNSSSQFLLALGIAF